MSKVARVSVRSTIRRIATRHWARVISTTAAVTLSSLGLVLVQAAPAQAVAPNFSIAVTPSANPVVSGTSLTWTISMTNTSGSELDGVTLVDQVPSMTGLVLTSTVGTCSVSANQVNCNANSLIGRQPWTVTVRGIVTAANSSTLNNTATLSGNQAATTYTQSATGTTLVSAAPASALAALTVNIVAPSTALVGSPITYNLTVNNTGGANAQGVTVEDTLPGGFTFASASGSSLFACSLSSGLVVCTGGQVNAGANATIQINATTNAGPGSYTDTAVVNPTGLVPVSNPNNNTASATTAVSATAPPPGLFTIAKTAASPAPDPTNVVEGPLQGQTDGQMLTYTITAKNTASKKASGVAITDGTTGLDASKVIATYKINGGTAVPCTVTASKVTCTRGSPTLTLNPGDVMTVTVASPVVALAGTIITNLATITGNINNKAASATASVSVTVRPHVDLTVTEQAACSTTNPPFRARDTFCYQFSVGNSGLGDATGVTVREPLPAGVIFVNSQNLTLPPNGGFGCSVDTSNVVTCTGGVVQGALSSGQPGGSSAEVQLNLVAPDTTGTITATTTVNPFNTIPESDTTNNTFTLSTVIVTGIDLTVSQSVNYDPVAPSGTLVYTIRITNNGTQDTTGVVLQDTLPAGVRYRLATDTPPLHNFTCSPQGNAEVDCSGGMLLGTYANDPVNHLAPDVATITVTLFAPAAYGPITNILRVDPNNTIPEFDKTNNINTLTSQVQIPTVPGSQGTYNEFTVGLVQKSPSTPTTAPNGVLTWTLTVGNVGSDAASNVTVQDFLPAGTRFISATASPLNNGSGGFFCSQSTGVVTCTAGALAGFNTVPPSGGTATITITVFAPNQPGMITNQADINPGNAIPEADTTNDVATLQTDVELGGGGGYIDLSLPSLTADQTTVVPNGILNYTLVAQNNGTDEAFNVEVTDTLPAGSRFRSAVDNSPAGPGAFTCSFASGVVDCTGGSLPGTNPPGGPPPANQRTILISTFAPAATGSANDQAQINPTKIIPEADYTNNTASITTPVETSGGGTFVDLSIPTLTVAPTPSVTPGGTVTYSMTVQNGGTGDATNVDVQDALPAGVTFVSATGSNAFLCSNAGSTVDCSGGTLLGTVNNGGSAGQATITITGTAPQATGVTITDQATINPADAIPESDYSNNTASVSDQVLSVINLSVDSYSHTSASQNNSYDYNATVTNNIVPSGGTGATAHAVQIHFTLPVGVIVEAVTPSGGPVFSCQTQQNPVNVVDCVGDLAAGASVMIDINVFDTTSNSIDNQSTVTVNPSGTIVESDAGSDTDNAKTA